MAIIDSRSDAKFDALIRTNKSDSLMSFIMATSNVKTEDDRKNEVAKRLKSSYELFRENIKNSSSGAGSYGDGSRDILKQFESQYTMGYEMGIWYDSNYHLNELAIKVSKYEITVSEYIGIVFLNLFSYYKKGEDMVYHHFLYEILKKLKFTTGLNSDISKSLIAETLPIEKKTEQANIIFNYLISTDLFEKIGDNNMKLTTKWQGKGEQLLEICNLEYKNLSFEDAKKKFKNKKFYSEYVTKLPQLNNYNNEDRTSSSIDIIKDGEYTYYKSNINFNTGFKSEYAHNRIIFGAPGTGKSYTLNNEKDKLISQREDYERVTFHPDYSYANFVGTYKPVPCKDSYGNETITYEYVPGPFMRILVKALQNSKEDKIKPFLLIIEEINRANVAAVFGDIFQLLDRDDNNVSQYPITTSKDMRDYLVKSLGGDSEDYTEIKIPNNMFIWATMNSADQGVFPMDTAFKRRWDFDYLGIDDNEKDIDDKEITLGRGKYNHTVKWNELRKAINDELSKYRVNEDKLLGPYFISKKILSQNDKFIDTFKSKVIMYLFDDAAKQKRNTLFNGCEEKSRNQYSKICKEFEEKGVGIFCHDISIKFINTEEGL